MHRRRREMMEIAEAKELAGISALKLLDESCSAIAILHGPDHVFVYANRRYRRSAQNRALIGKPFREAFPELTEGSDFARLDDVFQTGEPYVGGSTRFADLSKPDAVPIDRYQDIVYHALRDPVGAIYGIAFQGDEISERELTRRSRDPYVSGARAERSSLSQVVANLKFAQRVSHIGSWEHSIGRNSTVPSPELHRILGLESAGTLGFSEYLAYIHAEDRPRVEAEMLSALRGESRLDCEHRIVRKDGAVRYVRQRAMSTLVGTVQDVTDLRQTAITLQGGEALALMAARIAGIGGWSFDLSGTTVKCSEQACLIYEVPMGTSPTIMECLKFCLASGREVVAAAFDSCATMGTAFDLEIRIRTRAKRDIWIRCAGRAVRDDLNVIQTVQGVVQDIDRRKAAEAAALANRSNLEYLVHHDVLTGLLNPSGLEAAYGAFLQRRKVSHLCALIYIDLDHFKDINDARGRSTGDALLISVASRLRGLVCTQDLIVRAGGDEFVVMVAGLEDEAQLDAIAVRLMAKLGEATTIDGADFGITISMGATLVPPDATDIDILLRQADIALSRAKEQGRENYVLFAPHMEVDLEARVAMEQALRSALGTAGLFVEYQPIFDIGTLAPVAAEALLRWRHPQLGLVSPGIFIPIAEQSALIIGLGDWVTREVCKQIAQWRQAGVVTVPIYVNVSPRQLERPGLPEKIAAVMKEFSIPDGLLGIEITEGAVIRHVERNLSALQALRAQGARIAVDDFGTGYSSLSYLKNLPIDTLKIDRAFIRDMCRSTHDLAIVAAIVVMAHTLGLRTVAEGVETQEQLDRLAILKCDAAQGFHLGWPSSPECLHAQLTLRLGTVQ